MKREKSDGATAKELWGEKSAEEEVDEMLAAIGYKVRSSEMADVAQKLEQLEMAMGSSAVAASDDGAILVHLASDTVHYNPSDLSTWLDSMLSELNAPPPPPPNPRPAAPSPYVPVYDEAASPRDRKRIKTVNSNGCSSSSSEQASSSTAATPVVVFDSQEAGIRLVHALMACAEAVHTNKLKVADNILSQISVLAASQGGAMRKVAGYFAEALARRIYRISPPPDTAAFAEMLDASFFESGPYLKFAHFTANQAILEAFTDCPKVHVIDFGVKQGLQWPALLQALALRPGGAPVFRLTAVGLTEQSEALQQVGWKLRHFAETVNVEFHYRSFVASSLAEIDMCALVDGEDKSEAVAVNSVFEFHPLLSKQGAIEKVLGMVRKIKPTIVTLVEQEASHNGGSFVDRFTEALHYYSTMFDSLELAAPAGAGEVAGAGASPDLVMSEVYLGRQICNIVACEGLDRTERHETLAQWRARMARAGFEPVLLGSNAFKQASMLLALFSGGEGYRVEEREGCLTLGWHTRPLIATSAWRVSGDALNFPVR